MEESNRREKERKTSLWNELAFILAEVLFLRGVWDQNRRLWWVSFPFHFGFYMLLATLLLLFLGAVIMGFGLRIAPGGSAVIAFLYYLTLLTGFAGLTLGTLGSAGLLGRRLYDLELRNYSSPADFFNLIFLALFCGTALFAWLFHDRAFDGARAYIYSLLTFGGSPEGAGLARSLPGRLTVVLASLLIAYLPFTHMSHMFMKVFIYHWVRWEDEPNLKGSGIEKAVLKNLGFKPTWSAPHVGSGGKKTWLDIAASEPGEGPKGNS